MPTDALPTQHSTRNTQHLPPRYRRWHLYGAGLENVGRDGQPEAVETPTPGPDEILVRHDACGICFSDIKIINLGENHPRLVGRDLKQNPVVMGHEVALTVEAVGENLRDQFAPGQRYVVQADVYYQGVNLAYGYALPGGMSQYGLIGPEVLRGDEGCYLLPLQDATGAVEAALVEPWACVEAAYRWTHRQAPKPGGAWLYVFTEYGKASRLPSFVRLIRTPEQGAGEAASEWLRFDRRPTPEDVDAILKGVEKVDDVIFHGQPSPRVFEAACARLNKGAVVCLIADGRMTRPVSVDVGRIHYDGHAFVGMNEPDRVGTDGFLPRMYNENIRSELRGGGAAWFVGAGGPMGQMHVQRALSLPHPPARLLCTDRHDDRLDALRERFAETAEARGVELLLVNVRTNGDPDFEAVAPEGFDDIVVMVPSVAAIEEAFPLLARNGVLNVFAGLARGTMATLDMSDIATKNVRIVGTSGSSIADMQAVRDKMERGELDTAASLAAVGGLEAFRDGLEAVKSSRFPGKTVIFPHVENLPLTALPDLKDVRPDVYARLRDGKYWTNEAEAELLKGSAGGGTR